MVRVKDLIKRIEEFAPLELAYPWDNTGFIVGDKEKEVKKVFITLDVTKETVDDAVNCGADMILSHHPILLKPIQVIDYEDTIGYVIKELIKNDIALYASHTSTDCTRGGINDVFAEKLGVKNSRPVEENPDYLGCGLGRIGDIEKEMTLKEFCEAVKKQLNTPFVRVSGDFDKIIKTVAVGGGGCSELIPKATEMGADVIVTADLKYHIAIDGVLGGIAIVDAGHYPTEVFVQEIFEGLVKDMDIKIVKSSHKDVFNII